MVARSRKKPESQKRIAKERIALLFQEAASADAENAKCYTKLAKKIGMRYNVRLGKLKQRFCGNCYAFFTPKNSRIRLKAGTVNIKCLSCNNVQRIKIRKT